MYYTNTRSHTRARTIVYIFELTAVRTSVQIKFVLEAYFLRSRRFAA